MTLSVQQDLAALRARFFTAFDQMDPQVTWLGKPNIDPDDTKAWGRLVIEPGASGIVEKGVSNGYVQQGLITFTVTIPKGVGTALGYDMVDKFVGVFRQWRSADQAIALGEADNRIIEETDCIRLRVRFSWESFRRA